MSLWWSFFSIFSIFLSFCFFKSETLLCLNFSLFEVNFLADFISLLFFNTLLLIVMAVLFFSREYMKNEVMKIRFVFFLILFTLSMIFLIFSNSFFCVLIGWDGLGVTSFFLVIFFQNSSSWSAGMKTILTNRFGDGLLIIVFSSLLLSNNLSYQKEFFLPSFFVLLLILGSFTKSAQFPFSNWLPAAMAAPTPISALVHSSTLVTAGVFLMIRFSDFFFKFFSLKMFILTAGLMTLFLASLSALFEKDMKKVIALSTLSHLGLMMISCSIISPLFGFFHLIMHAIFKALLFINMGLMIIASEHNQDSRLLGLNSNLISLSTLFCLLSLSGFYFFNGFFSKDILLFVQLTSESKTLLLSLFFLLSFCITVAYSLRFFCSLFLDYKKNQVSLKKIPSQSIFILTFLSMVAGKSMSIFLFFEAESFFFYEKLSFWTPFVSILGGFFIFFLANKMKKMEKVESLFFLNFLIGNSVVHLSKKIANISVESSFPLEILLEKRVKYHAELVSKNFLKLNFSLFFFFFWLFLFVTLAFLYFL